MALALLVAPAQAQSTDAGNRKEQTIAQQLQAASAGDSVEVMLQRSRDKATPTRRREQEETTASRPDPNRTRLLFTPTARAHNAGEVYLASHELMLPYATVGIGGRLDVRAGISIFPYTVQFMYGGAKIGLVQQETVNLAIGALGTATTNVISTEGARDEYGGAAYALGTFGRPQGALTVGAGYLATGGTVEEQAFALLGGELRITDSRVKLLTENYLLFGSAGEGAEKSPQLFGGMPFSGSASGIASAGVRIIDDYTSVDFGAATSNNWWGGTFPVVPIITVSISATGGP